MNGKLDDVNGDCKVESRAGEAAEAVTQDEQPVREGKVGQSPCRSAGKVKPMVAWFTDDE